MSDCPTRLNKPQLIEKLQYQRSKTKWYMDENRDLKAIIAKHARELEKRDKLVTDAQAELQGIVKQNKRLSLHNKKYKYEGKKFRRTKKELAKDVEEFKKTVVAEVSYLAKDPDWDKDISRAQMVEVILRTIITYTKLTNDGITNYNEIIYLLVGSQFEAFDLQDVYDRVGQMSWHHKREFNDMVELGMFKKIYRKAKWHITVAGRDRLTDILKYIYENKAGTYRIVKKVLIEQ